jgi:hypothetical protein
MAQSKALSTRSIKSVQQKAVKAPAENKAMTPDMALDKAAPQILHDLVHRLHQDGLRKFLPDEANQWYTAKSEVDA